MRDSMNLEIEVTNDGMLRLIWTDTASGVSFIKYLKKGMTALTIDVRMHMGEYPECPQYTAAELVEAIGVEDKLDELGWWK